MTAFKLVINGVERSLTDAEQARMEVTLTQVGALVASAPRQEARQRRDEALKLARAAGRRRAELAAEIRGLKGATPPLAVLTHDN